MKDNQSKVFNKIIDAEKLSNDDLRMISGGEGMDPGLSTVQVQKPWAPSPFVPKRGVKATPGDNESEYKKIDKIEGQ